MKILAIESSCDETSAAVIGEEKNGPSVLSNVVSSQIDIHREYGGVVPEVAARAHIENILPVISESLESSGTKLEEIDYFAVTKGPGLIGSLVVGVETAKGLSLSQNKPLLGINHLEGHLYANFLNNENPPKFPILALLVSGGHTLLISMRNHLSYEVIGRTRDDAAGEAFDKAAKVLGLGYPGGPIISQVAEKGDENKYVFPIIDLTEKPHRNEEGFLEHPQQSLDFSFSGLKTALISKVKTQNMTPEAQTDLAASFQKAIVDNLVQNTLRAVNKLCPQTFILSGGVAANKKLRETLQQEIKKVSPETSYLIPDFSFCTDNAAMIGAVAYYRIKNEKLGEDNFVAEPNLKL